MCCMFAYQLRVRLSSIPPRRPRTRRASPRKAGGPPALRAWPGHVLGHRSPRFQFRRREMRTTGPFPQFLCRVSATSEVADRRLLAIGRGRQPRQLAKNDRHPLRRDKTASLWGDGRHREVRVAEQLFDPVLRGHGESRPRSCAPRSPETCIRATPPCRENDPR